MATKMSQGFTPPGGLSARYYGAPGGSTTYYYWVQAIYAFGRSNLAGSVSLGSAPAALSAQNFIVVSWAAMPGAIGYNVFRSTASTIPTVAASLVGTVTANVYTDMGATPTTTDVVDDGVRLARARYEFAVDGGGAPGLITLAKSDTIPNGAVIINGVIMVQAALVGSSTTIAIGTSAGSAANSIKTATAEATYAANAVLSIETTKFRMSADGTITITTATAALTAGTMDIALEYVMRIGY